MRSYAEFLSAVKGKDFFNAEAILRQTPQDIISIIDAVDEHGNAALHYAAGNRDLLMVDLLVKSGAEINIEDACGNRPLHRAVESGGADVAEYLLRKGADINAVNRMGNTVLHEVASKAGDVKMVTVLLKSNPALTANHDGLTPEDIAATAECKEMIAGYREWYVTDCNTKFNTILSNPMSSIKTASPSTRKVTFMDELNNSTAIAAALKDPSLCISLTAAFEAEFHIGHTSKAEQYRSNEKSKTNGYQSSGLL